MIPTALWIAAWTCSAFEPPELVGRFQDLAIDEASGLTFQASGAGFWTHNDSGDAAHLDALDLEGKPLGMIELEDTLAIDFEDLSAGPCGDERCLYVGDIGDNAARRDAITVYRLIEPEPPGPGQTLTQRPERLILSYPDGPTDAEGLAVDPRTGDVLIISKNRNQATSAVYRLAASAWEQSAPVVLERLGQIAWQGEGLAAQATAAEIDPTGTHLFVQTYTQGQRIKLERTQGVIDRLGEREPFTPWSLGQCEAMTVSLDGAALWFTCESSPAPLARALCLSQPGPPTTPPTPPEGCSSCHQFSASIWGALAIIALRRRSKGVQGRRRSI